jgi:hypothetical protein
VFVLFMVRRRREGGDFAEQSRMGVDMTLLTVVLVSKSSSNVRDTMGTRVGVVGDIGATFAAATAA